MSSSFCRDVPIFPYHTASFRRLAFTPEWGLGSPLFLFPAGHQISFSSSVVVVDLFSVEL